MTLETGKRLYEYRKLNGYSQEELAEKLGVSRQAISKWERAESTPDADSLIALSNLYNITIDELINSKDEPKKTYYQPEPEPQAQSSEPQSNTAEQEKESVSFKNGIHVHNENEHVDIGWDGIHVENKNGDRVHIGKDSGVNINNNAYKNPWIHVLLPFGAIFFYLIVGFSFKRGWALGWLVFFLIPIIETMLAAIKTKNPSAFAYPVFSAGLYLFVGMVFSVWHPTWIIFITIPFYYAVCDILKRNSKTNDDYQNQTYYSPQGVMNTNRKRTRHASTAATVGMVVISIVFAAGLVGIFAANSAPLGMDALYNSVTDSYNESDYSIGRGEISIDSADSIFINWVAGDVDVEYYNGEVITVSETDVSNDDYRLRYCVKNNELRVEYCKSGLKRSKSFSNNFVKDLVIRVPNNKEFENIDINCVSADADIDGITINNILSINSVSGNISAKGNIHAVDINAVSGNVSVESQTLVRLRGDVVSGDCNIRIPADVSGITINYDTLSGSVSTDGFDGYKKNKFGSHSHVYKDGLILFEFNSVSGDLNVEAIN